MKILIGITLLTTLTYCSQKHGNSSTTENNFFLCSDQLYSIENNTEAIQTFTQGLSIPSPSAEILIAPPFQYLCPEINYILDNNHDGRISRHELSDPKLLNQINYYKTWGISPP